MSDEPRTVEGKSWPLAVFLAWVLPGLGHWYLGRRYKAIVFCAGILLLFLGGWVMGQCRVVNHHDQLPFMAQILTGVTTLVANAIGAALLRQGPADPVSAAYQSGLVYTLVAGLLNLLVMLDAYIVANNIRRPTHPESEEEPAKDKDGDQ
jgi:hypothetical protein